MQDVRRTAKVFISSEVLALFLALVSQALSLYGIIDIAVARFFLVLAWVIAVAAMLVSDYLLEKTWKRIVVVLSFTAITGGGLFWLDRYATKRKAELDAAVHLVPPPPFATPKAPSVPIKKTDWSAYRAALPAAQRAGNNSIVVAGEHNSATNVPNATAPGISQVTMGGSGTISNTRISGNSQTVNVPLPFSSAPEGSKEHSTTTAFGDLPNAELKRRALDVASGVSDLIAEMRDKEAKNEKQHKEFTRAHPQFGTPEVQAEWDRYSDEIDASRQNALDKYMRSYRADAIALKNEMLNRLPIGSGDARVDGELATPTNRFGLEDIVTYLQIMANSLKSSR